MKIEDGVQFDPGFTAHISAFIPNIQYVYDSLERYRNFGQKKNQFKRFLPKLKALIEDYAAFYLGCMLWAAAIKTLKGKDILNNFCCGAEYNEDETLSEVNFVKAYYEHFPKDVKYYAGCDYAIDEKKVSILENYAEFLKVNKGFTELKTTDDIKLPQNFKELKSAQDVINKIEEVLEKGKLTELYDLYETVL